MWHLGAAAQTSYIGEVVRKAGIILAALVLFDQKLRTRLWLWCWSIGGCEPGIGLRQLPMWRPGAAGRTIHLRDKVGKRISSWGNRSPYAQRRSVWQGLSLFPVVSAGTRWASIRTGAPGVWFASVVLVFVLLTGIKLRIGSAIFAITSLFSGAWSTGRVCARVRCWLPGPGEPCRV